MRRVDPAPECGDFAGALTGDHCSRVLPHCVIHHSLTIAIMIINVVLQYTMAKTIQVSRWVYDRLTEIKEEKDHQTYDSAIRDLL